MSRNVHVFAVRRRRGRERESACSWACEEEDPIFRFRVEFSYVAFYVSEKVRKKAKQNKLLKASKGEAKKEMDGWMD